MFLHAAIWKQNTSLLYSKLHSGSCRTISLWKRLCIIAGIFFEFCCWLFSFLKEQRYLKFCIQRQPLALLALREKLVMSNSSHLFSIIKGKDISTWHGKRKGARKAGRAAGIIEQGAATLNQHFSSCFKGSCGQNICSFFHLFSLCKFPIKWLILHFKITQFKYAEHSPFSTDLERGVLFLSPHCRHRKLRTNCRDPANSGGKTFFY